VWIERLQIEGFRRLAGIFDFSPSLTVIVGDNEAGKSTLHDALVRTFFGFSRTERRRSRGSSVLERCAPWSANPYRLVGHIRNDGRVFRVEWDFATYRVRLVDELGEDVSHRVVGRGGEIALGRLSPSVLH
jgi:DNA repair exonuclease SbcCD ATPase subunit